MFSYRIDDEAELRLIEPRHAEQLNALIEQNRAHIREWAAWFRDDRTMENTRAFIRRNLARRGVSDYQPYILGMYERGFGDFRASLETHWQAYLDGKVSREAALRQILIETAPAKK